MDIFFLHILHLFDDTMARMHSRDKGKSKSTRPSSRDKPSWLRYTSKEVELLIVKLAKDEHKLENNDKIRVSDVEMVFEA